MPTTVIAFDFGTKNIGVAVGDAELKSASELPNIAAKEGQPQWPQMERLIDEWKPSYLVVGLPVDMEGKESEMTRRARKFGNRLHGRFGLKVEFMDERLSSFEAKQEASELGHHGHWGSKPIDGIAARLILESWWNT